MRFRTMQTKFYELSNKTFISLDLRKDFRYLLNYASFFPYYARYLPLSLCNISKILKETSKISIILKNLFFISCFFYFVEERQGMERTSGDERKHEISETFSPLYTSRFFFFFYTARKTTSREKMVKILNLLDHDKSRKDF